MVLLATSGNPYFSVRAVPKVVELGPLDPFLLPSLDEVLGQNLQREDERRVERNLPFNNLVENNVSATSEACLCKFASGGNGG